MSVTDTDGAVEEPIEYFLQDLAYQGKSDRTRAAYERVLRDFDHNLGDVEDGRDTALRLSAATHRDCMAYVHSLRDDVGESTVAT